MEWNEQNTNQFIEIYQSKQILWNVKHPLYYNKMKRHHVWEDVLKKLVLHLMSINK